MHFFPSSFLLLALAVCLARKRNRKENQFPSTDISSSWFIVLVIVTMTSKAQLTVAPRYEKKHKTDIKLILRALLLLSEVD